MLRRVELVLIGCAVAAACACAVAAFMYGQTLLSLERAEAQAETERYWDTLLVVHYSQYGDWRELKPWIELHLRRAPLPRAAAARVVVTDADGATVYATGTGAPRTKRVPLLYNGQIVGMLQAEPPPIAHRALSPAAFAVLLFAGSGIGFAATLLPALRRWRQADRRERETAALLAQCRGRLQQLERVRSTMIADVAHELRNPLATVRTVTESAIGAGRSLDSGRLAVLLHETYRMSKLVNDLHQLALAESGHLRLEKRWFSLAALLAETAEAMGPEAELRGIRIECAASAPSPAMYGDRGRLQQVVVNLLDNALAHARTVVRLTWEQTDDVRNVRWTVSDDGPGIEEEHVPYLFDRFYRSDKRSAAGSGLGLAIVKEFVAAHGGDVQVSSRWNEGSSFTVTLPTFRE